MPLVPFEDKLHAIAYINTNCGAESGRSDILRALMALGHTAKVCHRLAFGEGGREKAGSDKTTIARVAKLALQHRREGHAGCRVRVDASVPRNSVGGMGGGVQGASAAGFALAATGEAQQMQGIAGIWHGPFPNCIEAGYAGADLD